MATAHTVTSRPKVIVMGDVAVGKSALTQMFHSNGQRFPKTYNMTCGVDFCAKAVNIPDTDAAVELFIFDIGGQSIFEEMVPAHVEGAKGVVLVYDVTRGHTLERCVDLYHRLTEDLGNVPGVLVANKVDLRERAVVNRQQGAQLAGQLGMEHFECSAIDGYECDAPFAALAKMLHGSGGGDDGPGSPMSMS